MTKPKRVQCQVEGCQSGETDNGEPCAYWTDPDCSNVPERSADLKDHVMMVQTLAKEKKERDWLETRQSDLDIVSDITDKSMNYFKVLLKRFTIEILFVTKLFNTVRQYPGHVDKSCTVSYQ